MIYISDTKKPIETKNYCFVTLLSTENYLDGVLTLKQGLDDTGSIYELYCVVTNDIADKVSDYLNAWNIKIIKMDKLSYPQSMVSKDPDLYTLPTASKVCVYAIGNSINKAVYIDCDMFPLSNIDCLFNFPIGSISAGDNIHLNCYRANSSLFVFHPNISAYNVLKKIVTNTPQLDGSIIYAMFADNVHNKEMRIDDEYGFPVSLYDVTDGRHINIPKKVKLIHFSHSPIKPWNLSAEEYKRLESSYDCMPRYTECLNRVREKKKQIEKELKINERN